MNNNEELSRKERWAKKKAEIKAEKKAKKQAFKEQYKDAPIPVRFWNIFLKKFLAVVLVIALVAGAFHTDLKNAWDILFPQSVKLVFDTLKDMPTDKEEIYAEVPLDEEGAKRIQSLGEIGADETWTICYYIIGSDLEDDHENDLSSATRYFAEKKKSELEAKNLENRQESLTKYTAELREQGLDLPEYMYEPVKPSGEPEEPVNKNKLAERDGAASVDLKEITKESWSDNINIVIQTGGATHWSNNGINPNKTQRFEVKNGVLNEIANLPLQPPSEPDTLADFLKFCNEQYPADHRMVVLWDHGGASFGYGLDSIYGNMFSLDQIAQAFSQVVKADPENPYYDIIGFDACLMSTVEVAHSLYGYGQYLLGSEETEPGDGWSHDEYLRAMSDDPTMNAAEICQAITDTYMDHYVGQNINIAMTGMASDVTFSIVDMAAGEKVYQAYCDLNDVLLKDSIADVSTLTTIGRASHFATKYAGAHHRIYNTIDLGNYMTSLSEYYPKECQKVLDSLDEAVLYHRDCGYLSESTGLSVYMPVDVEDLTGISKVLDYINKVCKDDSTRALYYYKVSGCLNDEFTKYITEKGYGSAQTLDTTELKNLTNNDLVLDENSFSISLNEKQLDMIQDTKTELALYDKENNVVRYYGESNLSELTDDGSIRSECNGQWIMMNDIPLYTEIIGETPAALSLRSTVKIDGDKKYLLFSYDKKTEALSITGANAESESPMVQDASVAYAVPKTTMELTEGNTIQPIYMVDNLEDGSRTEEDADESITFDSSVKLTYGKIPDGTYLATIVVSDIRGDQYYSKVVEQTIKNGQLEKQEESAEFSGRAY